MTPYHFDNQENKQKMSRKKIASFVAVGIIIVGVLIFGITGIVRRLLQGPTWLAHTLDTVATETISSLTPKSILLKEYKMLQEKIQQSELLNTQIAILTQENEALRKELGYFKTSSSVLLAEIIAKPNRSLYNRLIINRGSDDGIMIGQQVRSQGIVALGEISEVSKNTATVTLYSGPQFSGDLVIKNEKNIFVPALGKGSGTFEIHIPREISIIDGDLLALPENQNIVVGVVKSIIFDPRDPFQTVLARIPVNVQELRFVEVVQ